MADELVIRRHTLGNLEYIGRGGTATVYGLPGLRPENLGVVALEGLAYKEYRPKIRSHAGPGLAPGLRTMVALRERLAPRQLASWDERIIWPLRLVVDEDGAATGIVMRLIPERFFQRLLSRSGGVVSVPRDAEKLFGDRDTMVRIGMTPIRQDLRIRLLAQMASTYALMHGADVVIGDISGRNLVYDADPERPAALVYDADSARLAGSRSPFGSQPHTPHWEPPEALAATRRYLQSPGSVHPDAVVAQSKSTDVYKFGLLVMRVLDYGRRKAVNRDPGSALRSLRRAGHDQAARLLEESLSERPDERPALRDWHAALRAGTPNRTGGRVSAAPVPAAPAAGRLRHGAVVGEWVFNQESGWHRRPARG